MAAAGRYERLELDIDWDAPPGRSRVSGVLQRIEIRPSTPAVPTAASLIRDRKRESEPELDDGWDDATDVG